MAKITVENSEEQNLLKEALKKAKENMDLFERVLSNIPKSEKEVCIEDMYDSLEVHGHSLPLKYMCIVEKTPKFFGLLNSRRVLLAVQNPLFKSTYDDAIICYDKSLEKITAKYIRELPTKRTITLQRQYLD